MLKENTTRLEFLKAFLAEKYFIFRQSFVNTYYALIHLTLGIEEPMEDEEDDSTAVETGYEADKKTDDGNTLSSADDTGHVADEARDKATGQKGDHHKQEL